ncbi:branched-chain amino acid ABC transporter substrate-binding protein [Aureimonas mangrovi]|uniref:branched-chain amino acid ABC transporter substrate-binding protein n=1 Tax=Aureimonas mangrovi TaxID=2758041 RepID=UPI00163D9C11|nr:branched-chain amino acid ABC transporter substrate-binding protein [Aureimonas mangrovi]
MSLRPALLAVLVAGIAPASAQAQEARPIGVVAPLSGPSEILGRQVVAGAAGAIGARRPLIAADDECTAEGGASAAREFVRQEVAAVVGFLCTAAIEAALPILTDAQIPVIDIGVRANRLTDRRERTGQLVWRLAPRSDDEADAIADFVRENWRDVPFGIIEDGSAYGRDLADEVRARLGPESIEPALVDNYRPAEERQFGLARRIAQSGVTRILAFGARTDIAVIARDAGEVGVTLDIVGGESLLDAPGEDVELPQGVRALAANEDALALPGTAENSSVVAEGYYAPAFAGAQVALQALDRVPQAPAEALNTATFDTVLGPVRFDAAGDAERDFFNLLVWDGERFVPAPQS